MFEEVGEQYHQFIASSRTSLPISLPFPLHGFYSFPSNHHNLPTQLQTNHLNLPQLHHKDQQDIHHQGKDPTSTNLFAPSTTLELEEERSIAEHVDSWSSAEVLALHKIRSGMENWFPDFTWEHVSRKLDDLGFKRSAEKCKEKFEDESRHLNNMSFGKDYRLLSPFEVLCQNDQNAPILAENDQNVEKLHNEQVLNNGMKINDGEEDSMNEILLTQSKSNSLCPENEKKIMKEKMKRKRHREFETLKSFCEEIVEKMMTQQEDMYNKIIEDMMRRDEEKIAKEEAWKKQEMERITKENEIRVREQDIASERQTKLINFLQKITPNSSEKKPLGSANEDVLEISNAPASPKPLNTNLVTSSAIASPSQNPSFLATTNENLPLQNPSSSLAIFEHKPQTSSSTKKRVQDICSGQNKKEEFGKRWPREEVLALINLRGSLNGNTNNEGNEGTNRKGPLWETISQKMLEMGYKRSAKRCKEKWENINKYFRKTKDVNKKRSIDSRTCPYFQQLSNLYIQGGSLAGPIDPQENPSLELENSLGSSDANVLVDGEKDLV